MYDFCISPIYAALLAAGGIYGYTSKQSTISAVSGLGLALLLLLISRLSLTKYQSGIIWRNGQFIQLALAVLLGGYGATRYLDHKKRKLMPHGYLAIVSGIMVLYYVWLLVAGPKATKKKASARKSSTTPTRRAKKAE